MKPEVYSLTEAALVLQVPRHYIQYAIQQGFLPEPAKVGPMKYYTLAQLEQVRQLFAKRREGFTYKGAVRSMEAAKSLETK